MSQWVPGGFGTCDCLLIGDGILHIIDFKYGQGVPVSRSATRSSCTTPSELTPCLRASTRSTQCA